MGRTGLEESSAIQTQFLSSTKNSVAVNKTATLESLTFGGHLNSSGVFLMNPIMPVAVTCPPFATESEIEREKRMPRLSASPV